MLIDPDSLLPPAGISAVPRRDADRLEARHVAKGAKLEFTLTTLIMWLAASSCGAAVPACRSRLGALDERRCVAAVERSRWSTRTAPRHTPRVPRAVLRVVWARA